MREARKVGRDAATWRRAHPGHRARLFTRYVFEFEVNLGPAITAAVGAMILANRNVARTSGQAKPERMRARFARVCTRSQGRAGACFFNPGATTNVVDAPGRLRRREPTERSRRDTAQRELTEAESAPQGTAEVVETMEHGTTSCRGHLFIIGGRPGYADQAQRDRVFMCTNSCERGEHGHGHGHRINGTGRADHGVSSVMVVAPRGVVGPAIIHADLPAATLRECRRREPAEVMRDECTACAGRHGGPWRFSGHLLAADRDPLGSAPSCVADSAGGPDRWATCWAAPASASRSCSGGWVIQLAGIPPRNRVARVRPFDVIFVGNFPSTSGLRFDCASGCVRAAITGVGSCPRARHQLSWRTTSAAAPSSGTSTCSSPRCCCGAGHN